MSLAPHVLIFFPLVGFLINAALYKKENVKLAGGVASAAVFFSFVATACLFFNFTEPFTWSYFNWIQAGSFKVEMAFLYDPLSSLLTLIITGVGFLIHLFSISYMSSDPRPFKYFAFLNLFVFNMLILVLANNLLVTFIGWEGVGLCSYLLIGFWFDKKENAAAGMKAFICNRIGDAGFLIGIFLISTHLGSLDYTTLSNLSLSLGDAPWVPWALAALFLGATGKSAQIPLFVWLPDAMAGPSPVSALIHAATMVTAGVFVLFRVQALLVLSPTLMTLIAWVGILTAFVGAFIACSQWDIKKILAYSTISQLGYMVAAVGVGAFSSAVFHLMTHAFFKALMFLAAGALIHHLAHEQDIRKMKGRPQTFKVTYYTFLVGWAAIIGLPFFSGFFSKDEILAASLLGAQPSISIWLIGSLVALLTAFYMTRLMVFVFWKEEGPAKAQSKESLLMQVPLIVLAALALFGGFLGLPHFVGHHALHDFLSPLLVEGFSEIHASWWKEVLLMVFSVLLAGAGVALALYFYLFKNVWVETFKPYLQQKHLILVSEKLLYFDQLYNKVVVSSLKKTSEVCSRLLDQKLFDGAVSLARPFVQGVSQVNQLLQSGELSQYVFVILIFVSLFVSIHLIF